MFREMRRIKQQLTQAECAEILESGKSGVLALSGDDGYPYAVPLNYVYDCGKIYFHCACSGHKLDSIERCDKASFCVIDQDEVVPKKYTTAYRSVIAFGRVQVVLDEDEKRTAIEKLAVKYAPDDSIDNRNNEIARDSKRMCIIMLTIEHMTGKEGLEVARRCKE
ncbi:MAG: pyridoxamine 5'-phosphate oxidase family protein [Clostridiales bacterium]|nr:pyridoxamine 5'-phosphate oxidase family protein [Clostridiales bacterium]